MILPIVDLGPVPADPNLSPPYLPRVVCVVGSSSRAAGLSPVGGGLWT
jgi:hypothetical protein